MANQFRYSAVFEPAEEGGYIELSGDPVAIVVSTGMTIDYCFLSEAMKSLPYLAWLRRGLPVPRNTATLRQIE